MANRIVGMEFLEPRRLLSVVVYSPPAAVPASDRWSVRVADQPVHVYDLAGASSPNPNAGAFAQFDATGVVNIEIRSSQPIRSALVRPISRGIDSRIELDDGAPVLHFAARSGQYAVEINGDRENPLFLAVNPIRNFEREYDFSRFDSNVLYFGPGLHDVGVLTLNNQHNRIIFVDQGAVLRGMLRIYNSHNIKILGHGIVDTGVLHVAGTRSFTHDSGVVKYKDSHWGVTDGITIVSSIDIYTYYPVRSNDHLAQNLKVFGLLRDGMNINSSKRVVFRDSLIFADDDCISPKANEAEGRTDTDQVLIENMVLWNDVQGSGIKLGNEVHSNITNLTARNIDILRQRTTFVANEAHAVGMENDLNQNGHISNILFENIRVESSDAHPSRDFLMEIDLEPQGSTNTAYVSNVTFRNISYINTEGTGQLVPRSRVVGGRANQKVTNVRFEGIWIYGDQKASPVEFNLSTNAFVEGVVVTQLPAPLGTGPSVRRPVVAALATQPFENSPITNALDGNPATEFVTNRDYGYIQFDLGAVRSVTDMRVMYGGTHWHGQYRFNLAVSDDGTHFRTIQTDQLSIPIGTWQSFSLPGETRARFIRYLPKAKTTTSKFTYLREIEFYGRDMPAGPAGKLGIAWASSTPHWTIGGAGGSLYAELLESTPRAISPVHAPKLTWSFDAAAGPQRLVFDVHRVGAARSRFWWRLNDGLWVLASADQIAKAPLLVPGVVELNEGVHRVTIAHESGGIQVRGIELRPVLRRLATPWIPVVPTHTGLLPVSDPLPERHLLVVI